MHCLCSGCAAGVAAKLQESNVFGLQAFEFHGGKGSAGKWKASIKAYPDGFPPEMLAAAGGEDKTVKRKPFRDTSEGLGPWLERECPEHPCLARSRTKEND